MNNTTGRMGCGCIALVFCVFMGVTAVSMGIGAVYPPLNLVAQPLVCPDGEMTYSQNVSHPRPGRTYITANWTCVEPSGAATPIGQFPLSLYAGIFYGLMMFIVVVAAVLLFGRRGRAAATGRPPGMM